MGIRKFKPTSPGVRGMTILTREDLADKDPEKSKRVMQAMLAMKKIDLKRLKQAYADERFRKMGVGKKR